MSNGIPAFCYVLGTVGCLLLLAGLTTIYRNVIVTKRMNSFAIIQMAFTCGFAVVYLVLAFVIGYEHELQFEPDYAPDKFLNI